jgi:hypothetical protein
MQVKISALKEEMVDREAIRHCLMRYCRGIDRMDGALVLGVYWPDAMDEHLEFSGSPEEFLAYCMPLMSGMDQTSHLLGNILIAIENDSADVESYFHAFHRLKADATRPPTDLVLAGRYLDRFERREDEWRIARRTVIVDWFRQYEDSADWSVGPLGMKVPAGARSPEDASCRRTDFFGIPD